MMLDEVGMGIDEIRWLNIFDSVTALVFLIAISECECLRLIRQSAWLIFLQTIRSCMRMRRSTGCRRL